jgi:hypothetical protein
MQSEADLAQHYANENNTGLYLYHEGLTDGLRRALQYVEISKAMNQAASKTPRASEPCG